MNPQKIGNSTGNSTGNSIILNLGNENMDHVKTEQILRLLGNIKKNNPDDSLYVMAGDLLLSFDDYICENPQNKNVSNSQYKIWLWRISFNGWKKMTVTKCLDSSLKNTAKLLTNKRDSMELQVGGFKNNTVFRGQTVCFEGSEALVINEMGELKNSLKSIS